MDTHTDLSETVLAHDIRISDLKPKYDAACKRVLANKIILAEIMRECLAEYRDFSAQEIAEKYIEGMPQIAEAALLPEESNSYIVGQAVGDGSLTEGTITYDVLFRALVPHSGDYISLIINVEAQNSWSPGYSLLKRAVYYASRLISAQYGREFFHAEYQKIKKVCSIWICMNTPKLWHNTINRYSFKETNLLGQAQEQRSNYDLIDIVIVGLGKENEENYLGLVKLLEVLFSEERKFPEKQQILADEFAIPMTEDLQQGVMYMCNLSDGVEERALAKGIVLGEAKGKAEGKAEGRAEGRAEGKMDALINLMASTNWPAEKAMAMLKIPEEEWLQYKNRLDYKFKV